MFGFVVSGFFSPVYTYVTATTIAKQTPLQYSRRVLLKTTYVGSWPCIASKSRQSTDPRARRVYLVGHSRTGTCDLSNQKLVVEDGQASLSDDVAWRREASSVVFEDIKGPGEGTDRGLTQRFLP